MVDFKKVLRFFITSAKKQRMLGGLHDYVKLTIEEAGDVLKLIEEVDNALREQDPEWKSYCLDWYDLDKLRMARIQLNGDTLEIDHVFTDEIICPYCGHECKKLRNWIDKEGGLGQCSKCNKIFSCHVNTNITYSTYKITGNIEEGLK